MVNVVKGSEKRLEVVFVKVVDCVFNIPFGNLCVVVEVVCA